MFSAQKLKLINFGGKYTFIYFTFYTFIKLIFSSVVLMEKKTAMKL